MSLFSVTNVIRYVLNMWILIDMLRMLVSRAITDYQRNYCSLQLEEFLFHCSLVLVSHLLF